ncbi:cytochrome P450 [Microbacterium sp. GXF7504]
MSKTAEAQPRVVAIPGEAAVGLLAEGYLFGAKRFDAHGTDAFRMRLLGRPTTFLRGVDAADFFYGPDRFDRKPVVPRSVLHSLQDEGSVQTLSGDAHFGRKAVFVEVATPPAAGAALGDLFAERFEREWNARAGHAVSLWFLLSRTLTATALDWLGIPYDEAALQARTEEFAAMIDGAGSFGPRNLHGRMLRLRTEHWVAGVVRGLRAGGGGQGTLAAHVVRFVDDDRTAGIELLNLLRPIVAVARFGVFAALGMHLWPQWRDRIRAGAADAHAFAQEVRRTTPFFPLIGGAATRALEWGDLRWEPGDRVVVDLFATNRDPRRWRDPARFDPDRFARGEDEGAIVAQGAGPMSTGHRCPGEPATVALLETMSVLLAARPWRVSPQDLRVDLRRFPAQPGGLALLVRID